MTQQIGEEKRGMSCVVDSRMKTQEAASGLARIAAAFSAAVYAVK
jgi:hypothetical protein